MNKNNLKFFDELGCKIIFGEMFVFQVGCKPKMDVIFINTKKTKLIILKLCIQIIETVRYNILINVARIKDLFKVSDFLYFSNCGGKC